MPIKKLSQEEVISTFPRLEHIQPKAKTLYIEGDLPDHDIPHLCVVGSRRYTPYGKEVCEMLIEGLRGYPVVIVSGLALGIDGIAHRAALKAGLKTIAVPGSGLDRKILYPAAHLNLAEEILAIDKDGKTRGALVSEYHPLHKAEPWSFPQRNRIMAGLCHATLIIEAEKKSGTRITARLALDYNREVLAVPHSIFSSGGSLPHELLKEGATPICCAKDILEALKIDVREEENVSEASRSAFPTFSENEEVVVALLFEGLDRATLLNRLVAEKGMRVNEASVLISMMEIEGKIAERAGIMTTHLHISEDSGNNVST